MTGAEATGQEPSGHESVTLMLVDDEPTTLLVVESFLRAEGYENLVILEDARQALDAVAATPPDLLLLDMMMPHVGGFEILETMQADPELADIPVIVLSGGNEDDRRKALDRGAVDFVSKPVDRVELALRLRRVLGPKAPGAEAA